jgi:hypothetical protein
MTIKSRAALHVTQQPLALPHQHLLFSASVLRFVFASLKTARPSSSRQMLPLQSPTIPATSLSRHDGPSVSQPQDVASGGHPSSRPRTFAGTQNADVGQKGSHTNANAFCCHTRETIRKRRGRSSRRREGEQLELSVSSIIGPCTPVLITSSELGTDPDGDQQSPPRRRTLRPHSRNVSGFQIHNRVETHRSGREGL